MVVASAMLWGTPHSAYFRPGFRPDGYPDYTSCGFFENAPLVPADTPDAGQDDRAHFPKAWFEDLKAAGIDAIDHCYFDSTPISTLLETAEAARASGTGVKVFPMMDNMPNKGSTFLVELWQNEALCTHPNLLRVGGCPVVMTFTIHGAETWEQRLADAAKVGGQYFVISDTFQYFNGHVSQEELERIREGIEPVRGLYYFLDLSPQHSDVIAELMQLGRSFDPPKVVGGCVIPGYIGLTRQGITWDPGGTRLFRQRWLDVIRHDPDFVYLTTLNDYTEATEQECSANSTYTFIDLNAYFGARWKSGQWPALAAPQAFLSYRKSVATTEPVEIELVLLRPELSGEEDSVHHIERFQAEMVVRFANGKVVHLDSVSPEVLPGHLVWRFWTKAGLAEDGYATPLAQLTLDGESLLLSQGPCAPFAVVSNGEPLSRRWLYVPLHRIRADVTARLRVSGETAETYPRTVQIEGLPWNEVACGMLERAATSLSPALSAAQLRDGFKEEFYAGPGWCPMQYTDGKLKRNIIDQVDRYTAVIRMADNTFVYPTPALVDPPRWVKNEPFVDPATVMDLVIAPGPKLVDRGWMQRHLNLPDCPPGRPDIRRDKAGPWYLRFTGTGDALALGELSMPSGPATLELWLRSSDSTEARTVFASTEAILDLSLTPSGRLRLCRLDRERRVFAVEGEVVIVEARWHHIVAVFTGAILQLYVNGLPDGSAAMLTGLRGDKGSAVGGFRGDIAAIRILQRHLTSAEVASRYAETVAVYREL
jgi:hypothetical protein